MAEGELGEPMEPHAAQDDACGLTAGIVFPSRFPIDALLLEVADALRTRGAQLAGVVQVRVEDPATGRSNLVLRSLGGGWEMPILEERGREAKGCRLDPRAVTDAAGRLSTDLHGNVDLLIVNRFGRAESEGYGLRQLLERAAAEGIPTLVAVREDYESAWQDFHGGLGIRLSAERAAILAWCRSIVQSSTTAPPAPLPA